MEEIILKSIERNVLIKRGEAMTELDIIKSIEDMKVLLNMDILYTDDMYKALIIEQLLGVKDIKDGFEKLEIIKNKLINQFRNGELS